MLKVENVETWGFEQAVDSLKGPFSIKSDSGWIEDWSARVERPGYRYYKIGEKDLAIMRKLCKLSVAHRQFLNYIHFSMDVTSPLSWWKGISKEDVSSAGGIFDNPIEASDFDWQDASEEIAEECEALRKEYLETHDFKKWKELLEKLPESYKQKRTLTMSYAKAYDIINTSHEDDTKEWDDFTESLKNLPYMINFVAC